MRSWAGRLRAVVEINPTLWIYTEEAESAHFSAT